MEDKNTRYSFVEEVREGLNFWDINQELQYWSPYNELIKEEGKRRSSRIMQAIYKIYDPKSSYQNSSKDRTEKQMQKDIAENYLNEKDFEWSKYKKLIQAYKKDSKTFLEKELEYWEIELLQRREYQRTLPWDTSAKEKDSLLVTQDKLFESYLKIKKQLEEERENSTTHGNTHRSLLEARKS